MPSVSMGLVREGKPFERRGTARRSKARASLRRLTTPRFSTTRWPCPPSAERMLRPHRRTQGRKPAAHHDRPDPRCKAGRPGKACRDALQALPAITSGQQIDLAFTGILTGPSLSASCGNFDSSNTFSPLSSRPGRGRFMFLCKSARLHMVTHLKSAALRSTCGPSACCKSAPCLKSDVSGKSGSNDVQYTMVSKG